jgi:single-stranded DNA-specific DHH superfamily exonuclease
MKEILLGTSKYFHEFVNSLSSKQKIGIVTHIDLDGLASAIFLQKILESKGFKIDFIEFWDYSLTSLSKILEKPFNIIFFTDCNIDSLPNELEILRGEGKVFVIDHHPQNLNLQDKSKIIKTESRYCSSHYLFDLAEEGNYFDTKPFEWLVCASIIADYCFEEHMFYLKSIYNKINEKDIWSSEPAIIGTKIANALIYYKPDYKKVYELVLKKDLISLDKVSDEIEEEIKWGMQNYLKKAEYFPEKNLYFGYFTTPHRISSPIISRLSEKFNDKTLIMASDSSEKGIIKVSARNQTGKVNLNILLKKCVEEFKDANAGGHAKASGASFPKSYLDIFKERLLKEL